MAAADHTSRVGELRRRIAEDRRELDGLLDASRDVPAADLLRAAFVGREDEFQDVVARLERLAGTNLPALIEGPRGAGKALLALAIHQTSVRRDRPFRSLDGPGDELAERWAAAERGTLLVRHVDRLTEAGQRALLDRIKAGDGDAPRVLATSLDAEVEGRLIPPLLDRLRVLRLRLQPISATPDASPLLFRRFLREAKGGELSDDAAEVLAAAPWPGNLRQLERVARLAADQAQTHGGPITAALLEPLLLPADDDGALQTLEEIEREAIASRLEQLDWAQQRTAESLGIDRKTLYRKIRRYGLEP